MSGHSCWQKNINSWWLWAKDSWRCRGIYITTVCIILYARFTQIARRLLIGSLVILWNRLDVDGQEMIEKLLIHTKEARNFWLMTCQFTCNVARTSVGAYITKRQAIVDDVKRPQDVKKIHLIWRNQIFFEKNTTAEIQNWCRYHSHSVLNYRPWQRASGALTGGLL